MPAKNANTSKSKGKTAQTSSAIDPDSPLRPWLLAGWLGLAALWLLLVASLVSHHPADPPSPLFGLTNDPPKNWVGLFGAHVAYEVYLMLGPGAWIVLTGLTAYLIAGARRVVIDQVVVRATGLFVMAIAASGLLALIAPSTVGALGIATPVGPAGLLAGFFNDQLLERFAPMGTFIILAAFLLVGAIVAADSLVLALPAKLGELLARVTDTSLPRPSLAGLAGRLGDRLGGTPESVAADAKPRRKTRKPRSSARKTRAQVEAELAEDEDDDEWITEDAGGFAGTKSFGTPDPKSFVGTDEDDEYEYEEDEAHDEDAEYEYVDEDGNPIDPSELAEYEDWEEDSDADADADESDDEALDDEDEDEAGAPAAYIAEKREYTPEELRAKIAKLPINHAGKPASDGPVEPPREIDLTGYEFPSLDLLSEAEDGEDQSRLDLVREQGYVLESAMQEYKIKGSVVGIDSGPTITLYEVALAKGTRVSSLERVSTDLARALKAQNIRIVPNMAGKDTVGVEVPNLEREKVTLRELMAVASSATKKMHLPMWLGKDASGEPLVYDLNTMPHMLIAGTTGSGKSVCMNSIIMSLLFTKRPDELKLVLVDPKMVEMAMYKDVPHLMCPVVTEMGKAAAILEWAVTKMDERYELLAEAGVRNIQSFNDLDPEDLRDRMGAETDEEWARVPKKLPYIVFIIDELADLMMTNKEVESHIVRIAQKARAVGLHLILATQRPQANVVTGLIKGNMPCRVSFRVASKLDSRIVLDQGGAELLLGHGDMLFLNPKTSKVSRCQGTFLDDAEVRRTVKFLKTVAGPSFEPQLVQIRSGEFDADQERDPLFNDAVEVVLDTQRGSVSLLQRKLTIGYSRASRMIEQMEAAGVLGGHKTAQAREVMISEEEWQAIKGQMAADAAALETHAAEDDAEANADADTLADPADLDDDPAGLDDLEPDEAEGDANDEDDFEVEVAEDDADAEDAEDDEYEYEYIEVDEYDEEGEDEDGEEADEDEEEADA